MEAKELMLNDWVYDGSINRQVTDSLIYDMCESYSQSECDEVIPIPITPEILEKNGWEKVRSTIYGMKFEETIKGEKHHFDVPFRIGISEAYCYEKMFPTINYDILINIQYVHDLQHALRLCGLNKLADNFKI